MNRVRALLSRKAMLAIFVLIVGACIYMATMPRSEAVVVPGPGVTAYYSNATYTTVVGARGTGCCGAIINWGITTQWKKFHQIYCTDQVCPN